MVSWWRLCRLVDFRLSCTWRATCYAFLSWINNINIKVISEIKENGLLWFLDIKISCENKKSATLAYRKPAFSKIFINLESFRTDIYKHGLIKILLHKSFRFCWNYENFHQEIETLMSILKHNSYHNNCVNHCKT